MSWSRIPKSVLAATLALLLPLEQAHCAFMGFQHHRTTAATVAPSSHGCCEQRPAQQPDHHSGPVPLPFGCACAQLPAGTLPPALTAALEMPAQASVAVPTVAAVVAAAAVTDETVLALDIGNPPLPDDPGAHGQRAPPYSA